MRRSELWNDIRATVTNNKHQTPKDTCCHGFIIRKRGESNEVIIYLFWGTKLFHHTSLTSQDRNTSFFFFVLKVIGFPGNRNYHSSVQWQTNRYSTEHTLGSTDLIWVGPVHVFGTVWCVGEGLVAVLVLAGVRFLPRVGSKVGLEVLESWVGLVAAFKLWWWEGDERNKFTYLHNILLHSLLSITVTLEQ